jgi:hypothetical protein
MVFATGSPEKADAAAEIMNHNCAVEIEELSALGTASPGHGRR